MPKIVLFVLVVLLGYQAFAQQCPVPVLTSPLDGQTNIPVDTEIRWNGVTGVPAYLLSIGTTPFGVDILNRQNVGNATSYTPPLGFPEDTEIYVTLTLFFFQAGIPEIVCSSEMFRTAMVTNPPSCTQVVSPANGAVNVNVGTNIRWSYAPTATSYDVSVGTAPGSDDVVPVTNVADALSLTPPAALPENTLLYVTVIPRNSIGVALNCVSQSFTTGVAATLPGCTSLISPVNGATNVALSPFLEWGAIPGANGYRVTIGLSPFTAEILNNVNFTTNSTNFIEFEPNRTFFIRIVPYNDAGQALGCGQETFSTLLGCGPFFDSITGELVRLNPVINFPDTVSFCENEGPLVLSSTDTADGFRWYRVNPSGAETFLADSPTVSLTENGQYRYEAYNNISQTGGSVECSSTKLFEVVSSELATITSLGVTGQAGIITISAAVSGNGDYEFALDNDDGPYQDSPVFENVPATNHTVYVRDKNGCGIVSQSIEQELALDGFPRFFTPNGDGINDFWQYIPSPVLEELPLNNIYIYDRYGKLLASISPDSAGWDGMFNGKPLPSDDYWFRAEVAAQSDLQGHFSLKR